MVKVEDVKKTYLLGKVEDQTIVDIADHIIRLHDGVIASEPKREQIHAGTF